MKPNPAEVASVHRVAFSELCRSDSPRFVTIPESDRPVVQVPIGGDLIHAPTGAVLLQFRRVALEGTSERVAAYEQPVFAWRCRAGRAGGGFGCAGSLRAMAHEHAGHARKGAG